MNFGKSIKRQESINFNKFYTFLYNFYSEFIFYKILFIFLINRIYFIASRFLIIIMKSTVFIANMFATNLNMIIRSNKQKADF